MSPYDGTPHLRGLEIVKGLFSNVRAETKFGHALSLTTVKATIWSRLGIYVYPATGGVAMTISSGSADDGPGNDGALTARVTGQNAAGVEVSQTLTLNGQTGVAIPTNLRRVSRIEILTTGSSDDDAGNIGIVYVGTGAIASGVPATIFACIDVGLNQTLMTPYSIPTGKVGYITSVYASLGGNKDLTLEVVIREPGEVFRVRRADHIRSTPFRIPLDLPIGASSGPGGIPAQSDVELRGMVDSTTIDVAAAYDLVVIDV